VVAQQDGVLIMQNKRVVGVHSQSKLQPFKRSEFSQVYETFSQAKSYQDWKFVYIQAND
jgi:hypothetical protein